MLKITTQATIDDLRKTIFAPYLLSELSVFQTLYIELNASEMNARDNKTESWFLRKVSETFVIKLA
jgi:hypothetical protein